MKTQSSKEWFREYNKTPERQAYMKEYRATNKKSKKQHDNHYNWNRRIKLLETVANGGPIKCVRCGIEDKRCISIHHTNGDGERDVKLYQKLHKNTQMLQEAVQKGDIELRCWNCNIIAEYETFKRRYSDAVYFDENFNPVWDVGLKEKRKLSDANCAWCNKVFKTSEFRMAVLPDKERGKYCSAKCFKQFLTERKAIEEDV